MNPAEDYILSRPGPYRMILLHLQLVIERTIPELQLRYRYKIPFFYLDGKPFCYLNQSKDYVDLGFWNAAYLTVHTELMETSGRKMMKSLRYRSLDDIKDRILVEVLEDAYSVRDKKFHK